MTGEVVIANMIPPAMKKAIKPFYLDVHNGYVMSYYAKGGLDYANVGVHVNGMIATNACHFKLHPDGTFRPGLCPRPLTPSRMLSLLTLTNSRPSTT